MKFISTIGLLTFALVISSCNTMVGVGRDIKQGGKVIGDGMENKGHGKTWSGE